MYRGMGTLYIGRDLGKRSATVRVKDADGAEYDHRTVTTGCEQLRSYVASYAEQHEVHIALEPVHEWYTYADIIEQAGGVGIWSTRCGSRRSRRRG
jgi:hypothetical protein